ncbi:unnamed protein product [Phytomonas sp. Hart1]|nr:unnamed protein product [Phytomonas sp. Hart1]|eukprot:CCW67864.1 unnamed protein product [Phytomonas sp. isolate Hart1]
MTRHSKRINNNNDKHHGYGNQQPKSKQSPLPVGTSTESCPVQTDGVQKVLSSSSSSDSLKALSNPNKKLGNQVSLSSKRKYTRNSSQDMLPDDCDKKAMINPLRDRHNDPKVASPWSREFCFTESVYAPRIVLCFVSIIVCILLLIRYYYIYYDMSVVSEVKLGLFAAAFTFIGFGTVNLPNSLMVRPHPAVWRAVLACGILYFTFMIFILFIDLKTVQRLFGYYDPKLLQAIPERAYATDCRIYTEEKPYLFLENLDAFIIAHTLGYIIKTFMLRDWRLVTCLSVAFEVAELSLQHILPNFRECWWDHLILDVILCNGGGTMVGIWLLRKLKAKEYKWIPMKMIKGSKSKTRRLIGQLGSRSLESGAWNIFEKPKRLFQVTAVLILMLTQELNCFTMKAILNMPPKHPLVIGRLALWTFVATPAIREFYEHISNPSVQRIGTAGWVAILGIVLETIWIMKMAIEGNYFTEAMPIYIAFPWMVAIASLAVWCGLYYMVLPRKLRERQRPLCWWDLVRYHAVNIFFYLACAAVLALVLMGLPDLKIGREAFLKAMRPHGQIIFFWR